MTVRDNAARILNEMPTNVSLLAAAKMRNPGEILEAIEAGVRIVGENYVQEAERAFQEIGNRVEWHFIGHLQKNKVKKAVSIFDMIETVDSVELAQEIDKRCEQAGKTMPVLIEINSGREAQKSGVSPEDAERLINEIAKLERVRIKGLMTMGPLYGNPEESRPYFRETKKIFDRIKELNLPNVEMRYLSMGMTNSYLVRIGSKIFGNRVCNNDITT